METASMILMVLAGSLLGCALACVPGLHAASTLALFICVLGDHVPGAAIAAISLGLIASYVIVGLVPLVFLSVPDEGLFAATNPAQSMQRDGEGYAGVMIGAIGASSGILLCSVFSIVLGRRCLPLIMRTLGPHWHWMVWCVIAFILMSEWPQRSGPGQRPISRFLSGWRLLLPGMAVFLSSALLGVIVFFRSAVPLEGSFASIMPMVTGMFSVPWLILAIVSDPSLPVQGRSIGIGVEWRELAAGSCSGWLGGMLACVIPGVTAGVGGLLAGHACSMNGRSGFLAAQGCARSAYMCGSVMLLFVPGIAGTRGACAMMIRSVYEPFPQIELHAAVGALLLGAAVALLLVSPAARCFLAVTRRFGVRGVAMVSLLCLVALNFLVTGSFGLLVMATSSAIGGAAMLYSVRRMNCLACILVPVALGLSGWGGLLG